jgi:hypothetical protein
VVRRDNNATLAIIVTVLGAFATDQRERKARKLLSASVSASRLGPAAVHCCAEHQHTQS